MAVGPALKSRADWVFPPRDEIHRPVAALLNGVNAVLMRGSADGASRTRTGDLLGAIQGAQRLNVGILQVDLGSNWQTDVPKIARNLR
jgi:hypothetical protein